MAAATTEQPSDPELCDRVRRGSEDAFETLIRRHRGAVAAVVYAACGDLATSEDVAQETFWAAWRQRESPTPPAHLRAWLCGVARNIGRNAGCRASRPAGAAAAPLDATTGQATADPGPG